MQDARFDQVFPEQHRFRSWLHWTPFDVAVRACALLAPEPGLRVLDVGSGVGKVCLVGATTTSSLWFGVERDAEMVEVATQAATQLRVGHRTRFIHADIVSLDWSAFDAFYLFNPFAELLSSGTGDALARRQDYVACIEFVQQQLAQAAHGTRVVTYHGVGGDIPSSYELVHREPARGDELCLWIQRDQPGSRRTGHS